MDLVEHYIGTQVEVGKVSYQDTSFVDQIWEYQYGATNESKNVIYSVKHAPVTGWEGKCSISTTSREVLEIAAPKITLTEVLEGLLEE